jgi:MFS family permease
MLALLTGAYILSFVDRLIISVVVEPLKADFALSDVQISLLQGGAFAVFYAIMGVPLGRLADVVNRKWLIVVGVLLWSIATVLCGLSETFAALFLARMLVGIGEAALSPAAYSMFADAFPRDRLARAIGVYTTGGALGNGIALIAGGALLTWFTTHSSFAWPLFGALEPWQSTFVAVGLPGLLVSALLVLSVREPRRKAMAAVPRIADSFKWLVSQRGALAPVLVCWALNSVVGYAYVSWAAVHLSRTFGLAPGQAGLTFGVIMISFGVLGPILGGLICDALTRRGINDAPLAVTQWGFIASAALGAIAFFTPYLPMTLILMCALTTVFTSLLTLGPVAIQLVTPGRMRGQMSGINLMVGNLLGLGLGPLLAATFAAWFASGRIGTGIAVTIVLASALGALLARRGRPRLAAAAGATRDLADEL